VDTRQGLAGLTREIFDAGHGPFIQKNQSAPVGAQRRHRLGRTDWSHHEAADRLVAIGCDRHAGIEGDVRNDHRLVVQHRPSRHAGFEQKALTLPEGFNRVFGDIMAEPVVPQHDCDAICADQPPRRLTQHGYDIVKGSRHCE
jgi:hypothetical protein